MRYSVPRFAVSVCMLLVHFGVNANTPLGNWFVLNDTAVNNGFEIAYASRPLWHFARVNGNNPCYPEAALINGQQHGTNPDVYPKAGTGCADPGPAGGKGKPFPTYYSVSFCGVDEIRIIYSLYFSHDGFKDGGIADGHVHDWERIIVTWSRNNVNGFWTRKDLLTSFHDGYMHDTWNNVPNTINYNNINENGGRNKDGAKIYVGWAKHAMFDNRDTSWTDEIFQGCGREYRSNDWWYLPEKSDLICAGNGCAAGNDIARFSWGSADSTPLVAAGVVCLAEEGGSAGCKILDVIFPPK